MGLTEDYVWFGKEPSKQEKVERKTRFWHQTASGRGAALAWGNTGSGARQGGGTGSMKMRATVQECDDGEMGRAGDSDGRRG